MRHPRLELVVTDSCRRCDDALDQLLSMPELRGATLTTREVLADERLYGRYAARVPVLRIGSVELDWPFDAARLQRLLTTPAEIPAAAPQAAV